MKRSGKGGNGRSGFRRHFFPGMAGKWEKVANDTEGVGRTALRCTA